MDSMQPTVTFVSHSLILVDGVLYKRKLTVDGDYPKAVRAAYMKKYRQAKNKI
jgi:hypothetical protein